MCNPSTLHHTTGNPGCDHAGEKHPKTSSLQRAPEATTDSVSGAKRGDTEGPTLHWPKGAWPGLMLQG